MKTKSLLIGLFLLLFAACKETKNDLSNLNINKKVKYIVENYYEALLEGDSIVRGARTEETSQLIDAGREEEFLAYETKLYFNEKGMRTEMSVTNPGISPESNELNIREIFNYNDKGLLEERISYSFGEPVSKTFYERDEQGRPLKVSIYDADDEVFEVETFQYEENRVSSIIKGENTEINKIRQYNPSENTLETLIFFENVYDKQIEKLNEEKKPIEVSFYLSKDVLYRRETYKYDKVGNETDWSIFYKDEHNATYTYKYKYDKHDNWTEQLSFENGEPKVFTSREIVYYK